MISEPPLWSRLHGFLTLLFGCVKTDKRTPHELDTAVKWEQIPFDFRWPPL